jgi:hypothetical protein
VASYTLGSYPLSFPVQVVSSGTHPGGKPLTLPAGALNLQSVSLVQRTRDYSQTDRPAPSFRKASIPEAAIGRPELPVMSQLRGRHEVRMHTVGCNCTTNAWHQAFGKGKKLISICLQP